MPMTFPDLDSLKMAARVHDFRIINNSESEQQYRNALADHVSTIDYLESCEIRNKVGWDQFSDEQNKDMLRRRGFNV